MYYLFYDLLTNLFFFNTGTKLLKPRFFKVDISVTQIYKLNSGGQEQDLPSQADTLLYTIQK